MLADLRAGAERLTEGRVAPQRPADRDNGMRRISSTTRWLTGAGMALVAAFSFFFAERASSSSGSSSTPSVNTPVATAPPATSPAVTDGGSTSASPVQPTQPVQTAPPVTYPPQRHTRSGGS
jgi:hypothetical protein